MLTYYSVWTVDDDKCKGTWGDLKFVLNRCAMLSLSHTFAFFAGTMDVRIHLAVENGPANCLILLDRGRYDKLFLQ